MILDPRMERTRQLAAEQRTPIGAPEDRNLADLKRVIHLLAQAMTEGRATS